MLDATELTAGTWYVVGQGSLSASNKNQFCLKEKKRNLGNAPNPQEGWRMRLRNSIGSRKEVSWQSGYAAEVNKPTASPDLVSKSWEGVCLEALRLSVQALVSLEQREEAL